MILINTLMLTITFWKLPMPFNILSPVSFIIAILFQMFFLNKKPHKWIGVIVLLALEFALFLTYLIFIFLLNHNAIGPALIISIALTVVHPILFGFIIGQISSKIKRLKGL